MKNDNQKLLKPIAFIMLSFLTASCTSTKRVTSPEKIVKKAIGIDAHNHIDVPFDAEKFKNQQYNLAEELGKSGFSTISMTFCVDRPRLDSVGEAFSRFIISMDEIDIMLKDNNMKRALNYTDVLEAHKNNQPFVVQSVEGGHFIEGKIERIQIAYDRGLRHLGLMHDGQSTPPFGDIYTDAPIYGGLTELGVDVIKECNRLGILIDLAHCSNDALNKAIEVSTKPILISHTGLNTQLGKDERMAKMMMPRLISKEEAKKVADAGGVIGVWTHLADSPMEYARNIKAMVDVVGIDHVCIGTDSKMATVNNVKDEFGKNTNQTWDTENNEGYLYTVIKALQEVGFTEAEIIKICGGNYWRIFDEATNN